MRTCTKDKKIYLLIGPKGSGKSFLGTLLDQHFNIRFVRVEDWAKAIKRDRAIDQESYLKDVFQAIERGVREALRKTDRIAFESTGLTRYFDQMLRSMRRDFTVITIKVLTEPGICLTRVKTRDLSIHVNVSDQQVTSINQKVLEKNMSTDFIIDNNGKSREDLVMVLEKILQSTTAPHL